MKSIVKYVFSHSKEAEALQRNLHTAKLIPEQLNRVSKQELLDMSEQVAAKFIKDPQAFKKLSKAEQDELVDYIAHGMRDKIMSAIELLF